MIRLLKYLVAAALVVWAFVAGAQVNTCVWAFPSAGTCMNVLPACDPAQPAACARPVDSNVYQLGSNITWHGITACSGGAAMHTSGWGVIDTTHWVRWTVSALPHVQLDTVRILYRSHGPNQIRLDFAPYEAMPATEICSASITDSALYALEVFNLPCAQPVLPWTFTVCSFMLRAAGAGELVIEEIYIAGRPCLSTNVPEVPACTVRTRQVASDLLGRRVREGSTITIR